MPASRRPSLDFVVPTLAALTVFAFAAGSSSVASVTHAGHAARWVLLFLLFAAAAVRVAVTGRLELAPLPVVLAAGLVALALVSTAWSVSPRLSVERAISLGLLFATAILLAASEREPRRLVAGLVAGSTAVALAGLVVLAVDHSAAVQAASGEFPARFRGFGQDANTVSLLLGVAVAPAVALALGARRRAERLLWIGVVLLFTGSIVASGSRGALFSGAVGTCAVVLAAVGVARRALAGLALVLVAAALGLVLQNVPSAHPASGGTRAPTASGPPPKPGYANAEELYPLDADVGGPLPGGGQPAITRGFFGGSGRTEAWTGALHQILQRPLLGFGFGTEERVFVDRYYYFVGGTPEDSYLGISLQLGLVGLVVLLALFLAVLRGVRRAVSSDVVAACAGAVVAGIAAAVVQSYVYSVGNIATTTLWICAFLLPVAARA